MAWTAASSDQCSWFPSTLFALPDPRCSGKLDAARMIACLWGFGIGYLKSECAYVARGGRVPGVASRGDRPCIVGNEVDA